MWFAAIAECLFPHRACGCPSLASGYSRQSGDTVRTNTDAGSRPSSSREERREGTGVDSDGVHEAAGVGCTGGWE